MNRVGVVIAGLFVFLVGCGSKDSDGTKTNRVTLSVFVGGQPEAGAAVYLHSRDGSLGEELVTDAAGSVTADVPSGGLITATYATSLSTRYIRTIGGLVDDDELEVRFGTGATLLATPVIVLGSALTGVEEYVADAGSCQGTLPGDELELSLTLSLYSTCVNAANTYDVMATAVDENFNGKAWAILEDVALATTTAFMPAWNTNFASQTISIDGAPPGFFSASGDLIEEGGFFDLHNDAFIDLKGGSGSVTLTMPSNFGYALNHVYFVYDPAPGVFPIGLRYDRREVIDESVSLNFATDFFPHIVGASFQGTVRPEVTFAEAPTDADYVSFDANWEDDDTYTFWDLLLPPSVEERVSFPELPAGLVPELTPYYLTLGYYDASYIDNYDQSRTGDYVFPEGDYSVRAAVVQP